jgi:hypothetical protein
MQLNLNSADAPAEASQHSAHSTHSLHFTRPAKARGTMARSVGTHWRAQEACPAGQHASECLLPTVHPVRTYINRKLPRHKVLSLFVLVRFLRWADFGSDTFQARRYHEVKHINCSTAGQLSDRSSSGHPANCKYIFEAVKYWHGTGFLIIELEETCQLTRVLQILPFDRCTDFCVGTNYNSSQASTSVCGDPRLGPIVLPAALPLAAIVGDSSTYDPYGALCPGPYLAKYTNATTGSFIYPPFDGFLLDTSGRPVLDNITLAVGTRLDRFGSEFGTYMSPEGVPYEQRSLPPTNLGTTDPAYPFNYHVYVVIKEFDVQAGPTAPWFEQTGLSLQFVVPDRVINLINNGFLQRAN